MIKLSCILPPENDQLVIKTRSGVNSMVRCMSTNMRVLVRPTVPTSSR